MYEEEGENQMVESENQMIESENKKRMKTGTTKKAINKNNKKYKLYPCIFSYG